MRPFLSTLLICAVLAGPSYGFDLIRDTEIPDDMQPSAKAFRCAVIAGLGGGRLENEVYLFGYGYRLAGGGGGLQRDIDIENRSPSTTNLYLGPTKDFSIGRLYQLILIRTNDDTLGLDRTDLQQLFISEGCFEVLQLARS